MVDVGEDFPEAARVADNTVPGMAEAIDARRRAEGLTVGGFAKAAGLTGEGLAPVRRGVRKDYADKTRFGVARALRWPENWYDRLVSGDNPADFEDVDHPVERSTEERLTALEAQMQRIEDLLSRMAARVAEQAEELPPPPS